MAWSVALGEGPMELPGYHLIRVLGEGGQGTVYLAEASDGTRVAVKVLHARFAGDDRALKRFLREVDAARRVAGFCTAPVLEVSTVGTVPYIVSEYVPGRSLQELVTRDGPRGTGALERLAVGTVSALAAIHRAGIIHRDFKPNNVLIGPDGPRVIDFGIARALDTVATQTSGLVGTPAYMSPEQITGGSLGPASDLFSWALTMVYAGTGRPAFGGDSAHSLMWRIVHDEPDFSALPDPVRGLVAAALDKNPDQRPTATDVLMALVGHPNPTRPPAPSRPRPTLEQQHMSEGEAELRAALAERKRTLGPEHPDTLREHWELGTVLRDLGRLEEAAAEFRTSAEGRLRVLGPEHLDTLWSRQELGRALWGLGHRVEAEGELRPVLEGRLSVLGHDHPDTFTARHNLGALLSSLGRLAEAETELRAAATGRTTALGPNHPDTLHARRDLGAVLLKLGR